MIKYPISEIIAKKMINEKMLTDFLKKTKEKSYDYQSKVQEDLTLIDRFDIRVESFRKKSGFANKYTVQLNYKFITNRQKLKMKKQDMYGHELNPYDISKNHSLFDKNYLTFIDGLFVDFVTIIPHDEYVEIVLTTDTSLTSQNNLTILFFSNTSFNPYIVNRLTLNQKKDFLSLEESGFIESLSTEEAYLKFVQDNTIGYSSNLTFSPDKESLLYFFKDIDANKTVKRSFINIFGFKNLSKELKLEPGVNVFQLPGYKMPIPVSNILVFTDTINGRMLSTDITVKRYYPNFYEIQNNVDNLPLSLLIYYSDENELYEGYYNELEPYYSLLGDNVTTFTTAPSIVKNYNPQPIDFSIKSFINSTKEVALDYKLNVLDTIAEENPRLIIEYLKNCIETVNGMIVDVSKINLARRIRYDNHSEIIDWNEKEVFTEERYGFSFRDLTDNGSFDYAIFIDGLRYTPDKLFTQGKYDYLYIPTSLINSNSIIEIERLSTFKKVYSHIFTSTVDPYVLTIDTKIKREDIFIIDSTNQYIDPLKYDVYSEYQGERTYYSYDNKEYIPVGEVFIQLNDALYIDNNVNIHVDNHFIKESFNMTEPSTMFSFTTNVDNVFTKDNVRVFKNGRKLEILPVTITPTNVYKGNVQIDVVVKTEIGDELIIDYTSKLFKKVFGIGTIPSNNIIYLNNILGVPFSLATHDIYLNGRKLNKSNIDFISPYLIQLKNISSNKNLAIYQKDEITNAISIEGNKSIIDILWETDNAFKNALNNKETNSTNDELDIMLELTYSYLIMLKKFWEDEMLTKFYHINPDVNIDPLVEQEYSLKYQNLIFIKDTNIMHINGDDEKIDELVEPFIMHVNPDIDR